MTPSFAGPSGVFPVLCTQDHADQLIASGDCILLYFSTPSCSVCHALKPRLSELLAAEFPSVSPWYVDAALYPELAARFNVFTAPVMLLFAEGREVIRKSRFINLEEFREETARIMRLLDA